MRDHMDSVMAYIALPLSLSPSHSPSAPSTSLCALCLTFSPSTPLGVPSATAQYSQSASKFPYQSPTPSPHTTNLPFPLQNQKPRRALQNMVVLSMALEEASEDFHRRLIRSSHIFTKMTSRLSQSLPR